MKKIMMLVMLVSMVIFNLALPHASAQMADGTYSVKYQVNKPDSSSASIANDYFVKPATVTVKDGTSTVQITLKNSAWITKFQPPGGAAVVSEDKTADTRVVQFTVKDLSKPVVTSMKIDIDDINYHHEYSVSLVFDAAVSGSSAATTTATNNTKTSTGSESQVSNPQTSDAMPYLLLVAFAGSAFLLYRTKYKTKMEGQ
ncbi:heme uptake protein IsdC [Lysinibacillus sp. CD3-6]|uniref:heme uptake protein IsdC n=1 Tax=Lysinibacillus sp. CD3-6 TaxID=2892541 RepID=UPI001C251745|nr:heme uptake protein IsdC [Lysinibacillus sp. CD3-6]UED81010.1 heme uptake protein IsdC [Lysinibacillus sp. CD3-6]